MDERLILRGRDRARLGWRTAPRRNATRAALGLDDARVVLETGAPPRLERRAPPVAYTPPHGGGPAEQQQAVELAGHDRQVDIVDRGHLPEPARQPARPHRGAGLGEVEGGIVGEGLSHCGEVSTGSPPK